MASGWFIIGLLAIIVIGIFSVLFFSGLQYGINEITTELIAVETDNPSMNVSDAAQNTFGYYNSGLSNGLPLIAAVIILAYIIATLIMAFYSSEHPIMAILYIIMVVIFVIFSVYVQNIYAELKTNEVLGATISGYSITGYIMEHLTTFIIIIGFIGIAAMIAGIMRGARELV